MSVHKVHNAEEFHAVLAVNEHAWFDWNVHPDTVKEALEIYRCPHFRMACREHRTQDWTIFLVYPVRVISAKERLLGGSAAVDDDVRRTRLLLGEQPPPVLGTRAVDEFAAEQKARDQVYSAEYKQIVADYH